MNTQLVRRFNNRAESISGLETLDTDFTEQDILKRKTQLETLLKTDEGSTITLQTYDELYSMLSRLGDTA